MGLFIFIFLLVIIIIGIYQYRKTIVVEDNIEKFSNFTAYGVPKNPNRNTAYVSVICDDHLHIYHDKGGLAATEGVSPWKHTKRVGTARCCGRMYKIAIPGFSYGDKIMFYNLNTGGPGYWAGQVYFDGKLIPCNSSTVKAESYQGPNDTYYKMGKYIGCYRDMPSRRLPYWGLSTGTYEQCQELAKRRGHPYFGTQYGGECWTGTDINRARSGGRANCTSMRSRFGGTARWTQPYGLGNPWTQAIYSANEVFQISHGWNFSNRWYRNASGGGYTRFRSGVYAIKPRVAGGWRQFPLNRWQMYSFTMPKPAGRIEFCPDKYYTEFNPAGCRDPSSAYTCSRTAYRPNYVPKRSMCQNKYDISGNKYENKDFYGTVGRAVELTIQNTSDLTEDVFMKGWPRDPNKPVSNMIDVTPKSRGSTTGKLTYFPQEKKLVIRLPDIKDRDVNYGLSWAIKSKSVTKIEVSGFKALIEKKKFNLNGQLIWSDRNYKYYNIKGEWNGPYNWMIRGRHNTFDSNTTKNPLIVTLYNIKPEDEIVSFDTEASRKNRKTNKPISYKQPLETIGFSKFDRNIGTWNPVLEWGKIVRAQRLKISDLKISNEVDITSKVSGKTSAKTAAKTVFKKYPNIDAGGNDIGYHRVNPKACEKIALNNKKAVGFVTDRNGTQCWIKSRFSKRVRRTQRVLYEKTKEDAGTPGKLSYSPQEKKLVIRLPDKKDGIHNSGLSWAIKSKSVTKIEVSGFKAIIEKKNFNLNGQLGFRDRSYKYYNIKGEWNGPYNWMIRGRHNTFDSNTTKNPLIVTLYNIKPEDEIVSFDTEASRKNRKTNKPISYKQPLETIGFSKFDRNIGTWNPVLRWGIIARAQRLKIPDLPIYKPPPPKKDSLKPQLIGVGRLNSLTKVSLPSGVTYVENKLYDKYGKEIFNPPKVALSITPKNISIVKASLKDKPKYISYRKQFYHVASLCCIILNWKDDDENLKECKRMAASMDIGYLNDLIKRAFEQSDKHAMKDGKSANYLTRKRLDEALKVLVDKSREIIAIDNRECGCTEFELGSPLCIPC